MKEYNRFMKNSKNKVIQSWIFVSVCFFVLILGITAYVTKDDIQRRNCTFTDIGFDTPVQFQATCSKKEFETYSSIVKRTFQKQNDIFDVFEPNSVMFEVNEKAYTSPVEIPDTLHEVIEKSQQAYALNPAFDISQGYLLQAWHDIREAKNPDLSQIENNTFEYGMDAIVLNEHSIHFTKDIHLDLGGIAKGYTAQLAKEALNEAGLHNGFINAGGNVVLLGEKEDGSDWTIGIQNPDSQESIVQVSTKKPIAFVTSGDYQRYVNINGINYGHIIDPKTKYPATYVRSVTVLHEDSGFADAMSTALFCMSVEDGMKFCEENNLQAIWITEKNDEDCFLQTEDFNIYATKAIQPSVELSQNFTK